MVAASPLLAMTLGAEITFNLPSVSARAREASKASAPNPVEVRYPKLRPKFAAQLTGELLEIDPPHKRSPPAAKPVGFGGRPNATPVLFFRCPVMEFHCTPRSRPILVVASTMRASIMICLTGVSNSSLILLASSMILAVSVMITVFERASTLMLPRSLFILSRCGIMSEPASAKSTRRYSVMSGSSFLAFCFFSSLSFSFLFIAASMAFLFLSSACSIWTIFALVVIQMIFPSSLLPRLLLARIRSSACSHGTFFSRMETLPLTSGPQITFRLLTSPISLRTLVTSALLKSIVMLGPRYLPFPIPGMAPVCAGPVSVRPFAGDFTCACTSFTGIIFFAGRLAALWPKSMCMSLSV